jgi:hypothetical protein
MKKYLRIKSIGPIDPLAFSLIGASNRVFRIGVKICYCLFAQK